MVELSEQIEIIDIQKLQSVIKRKGASKINEYDTAIVDAVRKRIESLPDDYKLGIGNQELTKDLRDDHILHHDEIGKRIIGYFVDSLDYEIRRKGYKCQNCMNLHHREFHGRIGNKGQLRKCPYCGIYLYIYRDTPQYGASDRN